MTLKPLNQTKPRPKTHAQAAPACSSIASMVAEARCGEGRTALLAIGMYRVRLEALEPHRHPVTGNETTHAILEILEAADGSDSRAGQTEKVIFTNNSYGATDLRAFLMAASGFDPLDNEGFAVDVPDIRDLVDLTLAGEGATGSTLEIQVSRGKDDGQGGYYRNITCGPDREES